MFLFADLNLCHVSKWDRSSAQGLQQVLHVISFPGFIKCLIFIREEEEGLPWPLGPWLLCICLLGDLYYNPFGTEKQEVGICAHKDCFPRLHHCWDVRMRTALILSSSVSRLPHVHGCQPCCTQCMTCTTEFTCPRAFLVEPKRQEVCFLIRYIKLWWKLWVRGHFAWFEGVLVTLLNLSTRMRTTTRQSCGSVMNSWEILCCQECGTCLVGCWAAPQLTGRARSPSRCPM